MFEIVVNLIQSQEHHRFVSRFLSLQYTKTNTCISTEAFFDKITETDILIIQEKNKKTIFMIGFGCG